MERRTQSRPPQRLPRRSTSSLGAALCCVALITAAPAEAQTTIGLGEESSGNPGSAYAPGNLPAEIEELLTADPLPPITVSPSGRYALLVHRRQLLSLDRLAEPSVRIAGRRIDPRTKSGHAPLEYYGLTLVDLATGDETRLRLPAGVLVGFPSWAPDGSRFAFSLSSSGGTEIWVGEPGGARAWPLAHSINAALGQPCAFTPDSRRLLCRRVPNPRPRGRIIDIEELVEHSAQAQGVGQPLVLNGNGVGELLESQLELIDIESRQRHLIGKPAAIEAVEPAPAGAFLLVTRFYEPYPRIEGVDSVARVTEVWDRFGNVVATVPSTARAAQWQASQPATVVWVERRAGVDQVMLLEPPYTGSAAAAFDVPHRFSGLRWLGETNAVLVSDYVADARRTDQWLVELEAATPPRMITSYPSSGSRESTSRSIRAGAEPSGRRIPKATRR